MIEALERRVTELAKLLQSHTKQIEQILESQQKQIAKNSQNQRSQQEQIENNSKQIDGILKKLENSKKTECLETESEDTKIDEGKRRICIINFRKKFSLLESICKKFNISLRRSTEEGLALSVCSKCGSLMFSGKNTVEINANVVSSTFVLSATYLDEFRIYGEYIKFENKTKFINVEDVAFRCNSCLSYSYLIKKIKS